MKNIKLLYIIALSILLPLISQAEVKLPSIISDGMALQCNGKAKIWGRSNQPRAKKSVSTSWNSITTETVADEHGDMTENMGRQTFSLSDNKWFLWQDKTAAWQNDRLYLPDEAKDLGLLPVNAPTGGWQVLTECNGRSVHVPGTVEEFCTVSDQPQPKDNGGVSWWWRKVKMSVGAKGKRVVLHFESVRTRAEVYLDGRLVAYDIVGESPFDADITEAVKPGEEQLLAVRVTNPGGEFHWQDFNGFQWGNYQMPPGRGFGGIIGRVWIDVVSPVYVEDVYMQNQPDITTVKAVITVRNMGAKTVRRDVVVSVREKENAVAGFSGDNSVGKVKKPVKTHTVKAVVLTPGDNTLEVELACNGVQPWDLDSPALYTCGVELKSGKKVEDSKQQDFGFRWFSPDGIGRDAVLRLNGRRVMLRTAISWGYWPVTGLYATEDMAVKQVNTAKSLGLNMLNFHRSIGSPIVLEKADSIGLLYYEEPGSFHSAGHDPFIRTIVNTKLQRMVKRDRSHPSIVIYNLINELGGERAKDKLLVAKRMDDMRKAHALDPSRVMTFTSGWASREDTEEDSKAHMLPFDTLLHRRGWFDNHRAGGPATWEERYYRSPKENLMHTDNRTEVYMRGEEGALSTPPRIAGIASEIDSTGVTGWDGLFWKKQYAAFEEYFKRNNLAPYFGSVDSLTRLMGDVSFDHQGRRIQGMRMQNLGDAYAVNGWESMPYDNHSGIVDIYRNPKGNLSTFRYYTQPLYVAVVPRKQFVSLDGDKPGKVNVDIYIVNEKNLTGKYPMEIKVTGPEGGELVLIDSPILEADVKGGDVFGQLLLENVELELGDIPGMYRIDVSLVDRDGNAVATGHDDVLAVGWNKKQLAGNGALFGAPDSPVASFYKKATGKELPIYNKGMGKLDWIVVTRPSLDAPQPVPVQPKVDGKDAFTVTFFKDDDIQVPVGTGTDSNIDRTFNAGAQPDASLAANQSFSVIWCGKITAPQTGTYMIGAKTTDGMRLSVNGTRLIDEWGNNKPATFTRPVRLKAGEQAEIELMYRQRKPSGSIQMVWARPGDSPVDPNELFDRVANDGTALLLIDNADSWMEDIARYVNVGYKGYYVVGKDWIGGVHFVKESPLFKELPVNCAMGWPYQEVVRNGDHRTGFIIDSGEMVAGSYRSWPFHLGSAVGILPCGKGRIIYSTLNIVNALDNSSGASEVARKLFCNFVEESSNGKSRSENLQLIK